MPIVGLVEYLQAMAYPHRCHAAVSLKHACTNMAMAMHMAYGIFESVAVRLCVSRHWNLAREK